MNVSRKINFTIEHLIKPIREALDVVQRVYQDSDYSLGVYNDDLWSSQWTSLYPKEQLFGCSPISFKFYMFNFFGFSNNYSKLKPQIDFMTQIFKLVQLIYTHYVRR